MIAVNRRSYDPTTCPILPFEYVDYPQDMTNSGCDCPTDPNCKLNVRKGRLAMAEGRVIRLDDDSVVAEATGSFMSSGPL